MRLLLQGEDVNELNTDNNGMGYLPEEYQGGKHSDNRPKVYSINDWPALCSCPLCREYRKSEAEGRDMNFDDIIESVKEEVAKNDNNAN